MKRGVKKFLVLGVAAFVILFAAAQFAVGFPSDTQPCTQSGCHDNPSGITIVADSTVDTEPGGTFNLDVQVNGLAGELRMAVMFPSEQADNALFDYVGLNAEGLVDDQDGNDLDTDVDEVRANYTIIAPDNAGTYTLHLYAAQHRPNGNLHTITVSVVPSGPGPAILNVTAVPSVPLADEPVNVTAEVSSAFNFTSVILQYSLDNGTTWDHNVTMTQISGNETYGIFWGQIPGQADDIPVAFRVIAEDEIAIESVSGTLRFVVGDIPLPPLPPPPQLHYGFLLGAPAIILAYLGTALEYYDEERFTRAHGILLTIAYFLTLINVIMLFMEDAAAWTALNPSYLFNMSQITLFIHSWHIWLGIISMIFGTLALLTHLAGWKTCNLGLPAVILWTILGMTGFYLNSVGFLQ